MEYVTQENPLTLEELEERKVTMDKYIEAVEKQIKNSVRPLYYGNETLGEFSLSIYDVDECARLFDYMNKHLIEIGYYYYDIFDEVIGRLMISSVPNVIDDGRPYADLNKRRINTEGRSRPDNIHVKYWITSKDGSNNETKPQGLLKLEGRVCDTRENINT